MEKQIQTPDGINNAETQTETRMKDIKKTFELVLQTVNLQHHWKLILLFTAHHFPLSLSLFSVLEIFTRSTDR